MSYTIFTLDAVCSAIYEVNLKDVLGYKFMYVTINCCISTYNYTLQYIGKLNGSPLRYIFKLFYESKKTMKPFGQAL